MLVLARKKGEVILLGRGPDQIRITVTDINRSHSQVRIGIEAPKEVLILRAEIEDDERKPGVKK